MKNGVPQAKPVYLNYEPSTGIDHLSNGDIVVIVADTKGSTVFSQSPGSSDPYKLDPAYNNTPLQLPITQLRVAASAQGVGTPAITITGYQAHGKISDMFDSAGKTGALGTQ